MDKCSTCDAPIFWAITVYGNRAPINADPDPNGNLALQESPHRKEPNVVNVGKPDSGALFDEYAGRRYLNHFATCPQSKQHRRKG